MSVSYALSLNNIAILYKLTGKQSEAMESYKKALNVFVKLKRKNHKYILLSYNNIGDLFLSSKQYESAIYHLMKSIASNIDDSDNNFNRLLSLFGSESNFDTLAYNYYEEFTEFNFSGLAKEPFSDFSQLKLSLRHLSAIAKILAESNNVATENTFTELQFNINKTITEINKNIYNNFSSDRDKLRNLRNNKKYVVRATEIAAKVDNPDFIRDAFSMSDQNKSMLLKEVMNSLKAKNLNYIPDSLLGKERSLKKKSDENKKKKINATTNIVKQQLIAEENKLNMEIDIFKGILKSNYPEYYSIRYHNKTKKLEDIQKILPSESLLLQYLITDSVTYLFKLSKDTLQLLVLDITKEKLNTQISKFYDCLSNYSMLVKNKRNQQIDNYKKVSYWFYKNLLYNALEHSDAKKLIIIPDGLLSYLPFESFLTEIPGSEVNSYENLPYLLYNYSINYNYSSSLWKELRTRKPNKNNKKILAVASDYFTDSISLINRSEKFKEIRNRLGDLPSA